MSRTDSTSLSIGLVILLHLPFVHNGFACLSDPCIHGVCMDDLNSTYFCYCIDGYTGLQCQTNWNDCWSSPCQNGGLCVDGIASFNCTCPPGFVGDLCEEDFNECESNPCWNNGSCVDGPNGYLCQCLAGYSGIHCEVDIAVCNITDEARCQNAGVCVEGPGDTFSCNCQLGWEGFLCDVESNECISAPCQNDAVCIDLHANYECACLFGYTGRNCEELIQMCETNPCKNGALCLIEDGLSVCYCVPDFHGELCQLQYDECVLGPKCSNGGTCIDGIDNFTCSCPPNLTGVFCECLILPNNNLDCNYISPVTTASTLVTYSNTTIIETESSTSPTYFSEKTTLPSSSIKSITTTTTMPNTSQISTETSTVPFCITRTSTGRTLLISTTLESISLTTLNVDTTSTSLPTVSTSLSSVSTLLPTVVVPLSTITSVAPETSTITLLQTTLKDKPETTSILELSTMETFPETESTTTLVSSTSTDSTTKVYTETTKTSYETTTAQEATVATISTTVGVTEAATKVQTETTLESTGTTTTEYTTTNTTTVKEETTTSTAIPTYTETESSETTLLNITNPTESSTFTTETSGIPYTTTTMLTTVTDATESNRSFSETSTFPHLTTFLSEEPSTSTVATTSMSTETTTIASTTMVLSVDCSIPDQVCEHGGTCIFTHEGHKCICPFDAEGPYCEIKLGIRNAAFTGQSYISHRLPQNQNISLKFDARTLSNQGLLFYVHVDSTYMTLFVKDGFLAFKFSCGYQTMLLSELKVPVNDGWTMNVKASLNFSSDLKHCYALIKVNDTLTMSGDQMAFRVDKFSTSPIWLHLGGVPNENIDVPGGGFMGCMSNLTISGKKVFIYKDAEDGYEITECSSLACLSNPCRNGASCTSHGDDWKCHCRNGFLGYHCEVSICDNNPCLFGGTCIPFSNSGYICLCPYGKHGHFCENTLKISEPYFSSTVRGLASFVAYPLPEGTSQKMEIKFRFTPSTMDQISLLLFMGQSGQHDFYSDHLAVSFVKGYVMLTWNMGSGPRRIFTSQPIEEGARDYLVQLGYEGRRAWLFVENLGNITGRSPGRSVQLNTAPLLYLGGHQSINFSLLPHDLPLHSGFSGCIFDVEIKAGSIVFPLETSTHAILGRAVGQCGTTECYERSCQNGGACLHHGSTFMCLCQDKWFGPLCSSSTNFCDSNNTMCSETSRCVPLLTGYECDCPLGKIGLHCDTSQNITDISFTGTRSYLSTVPVEIDSDKFNIEMEIRILKDTGVVLYLGNSEASFVCLSIQSGLLELRLRSSKPRTKLKDLLTVRSSKLLLKGVWHKVQFGLFGRKVYLYVDHVINMGLLDHGFTLNLTSDSLYLGGLPDMSRLPFGATSGYPISYSGCLRRLSVNQHQIVLNDENILSARNVIDCDGTPCGGEVCHHGGTCWLDSLMNPHCSCVAPYYGDQCQFFPKCNQKSCKNGYCLTNSTCACRIGFEGGFCETQIEVKTPSFRGQSYLIVEKPGDKKRNIRDSPMQIRQLYLNFTTTENEGLLLWTKKGPHQFLGIGLEMGHLKIVFSFANNSRQVEVAPTHQLVDGLWHTLELKLQPLQLKIDSQIVRLSGNQNESHVFTNGKFFIGGIPNNVSFIEETSGIFRKNFEGCIEAFGANGEKVITDFTPFEGADVGNCNVI